MIVFSWPLPASRITSPACASPMAWPIAVGRSSITNSVSPSRAPAAARAVGDGLVDEARILQPGVLVGDDGDVGQLGTGTAHGRSLGGIPLPAEPKTMITRPLASGRRMRSTLPSESVVCA